MVSFSKLFQLGVASLVIPILLVIAQSNTVNAATTGLVPTGKISFTFDDGYKSALTKAAPALAESGITGTNYVTTGFIGSNSEYMSWAELSQLAGYGWEIGGHSADHPLSTTITAAQMEQEASLCKTELKAHGFNPTSYATPFGDYDSSVIQSIARHYSSHRPFHDAGYNTWPYNDYLLKVQQVQSGVSVETVKSYIDTARANNQWLVLVFHDIKDVPSTDPQDYEYSTTDLKTIAQYVKSVNMKSVNVTDGLVNNDSNLMPGGNFTTGIANGWSTDTPANIVADTQNHGAGDDPTNSVKVTSGTKNEHLFSPEVAVNPVEQYVIKAYINIQTIVSGEIAFYIDELNALGNWISGVYAGAIRTNWEKELAVAYTPTSASVTKARLQIITTANSGIVAYIDAVKWFSTTATSTPTPPVTPTPTPTPVNLLSNPGFESGLTGWTTDVPAKITLDTANNGGTTTKKNSVKIVATTKNAHLFSGKVSVDATRTYNIKGYLNVTKRTSGAIGLYIDEYDASGNWISGKYVLDITKKGITNFSINYKPTSANVKSASIQVIAIKSTGITAYLDDLSWFVI